MNNEKNRLGQHFTPIHIADFMVGLSDASPDSLILEPACGEGVFIDALTRRGFTNIRGYEIDGSLQEASEHVLNQSFISASVSDTFNLIIGNPPYIRWKNLSGEQKDELTSDPIWKTYFNSLCDYYMIFILRSVLLLRDGGELIFICPEYWLNAHDAQLLRNFMADNGHFEQIYHFNEAPVFDNIGISLIIFKYRKGPAVSANITVTRYKNRKKISPEILDAIAKHDTASTDTYYIPHFSKNTTWSLGNYSSYHNSITLEEACSQGHSTVMRLSDICYLRNGIVSGLDKAFQIDDPGTLSDAELVNTIKVLKARQLNKIAAGAPKHYIFIKNRITEDVLKNKYPSFYARLQPFKDQLADRYSYGKQIHYWEWAFLRNFNMLQRNEKRIFAPLKERVSSKGELRFSIVDNDIYAAQDVVSIFKQENTAESLEYIAAYLNLPCVFEWVMYNGIVKGGVVQLSVKSLDTLPVRTINWKSSEETALHDKITNLTQEYSSSQSADLLKKITDCFSKLLKRSTEEDASDR